MNYLRSPERHGSSGQAHLLSAIEKLISIAGRSNSCDSTLLIRISECFLLVYCNFSENQQMSQGIQTPKSTIVTVDEMNKAPLKTSIDKVSEGSLMNRVIIR